LIAREKSALPVVRHVAVTFHPRYLGQSLRADWLLLAQAASAAPPFDAIEAVADGAGILVRGSVHDNPIAKFPGKHKR
jgi:hypothetical protein